MSVYKEAFHIINSINSKSVNIFSDSCDFGVPVKMGDSMWNLTNQLATWYGDANTKKVNVYSTGKSVDITVTTIDEWAVSDERKTIKQATENYNLSFVTCKTGKCKGYDGYVTLTKL
jgi:hypothetical protein